LPAASGVCDRAKLGCGLIRNAEARCGSAIDGDGHLY
jgi:hypothetical protein